MTDDARRASTRELVEDMVRDPIGHERMDLEIVLGRCGYEYREASYGAAWVARGLPVIDIPFERDLPPSYVAHVAARLLAGLISAGFFEE